MSEPGNNRGRALAAAHLGLFLLCSGATAASLCHANAIHLIDLQDGYDALRGSVFTGFFTIGGFLLTLKNLILTSVRTGVYDQEPYQRLHLQRAANEPLYEGLRNLHALIHASILSAFVTSFAQLTLGLLKREWTAVLCLSLAAGTAALLVKCLFHLRANLQEWFNQLDKEWEERGRPNLEEKIAKEKASRAFDEA